MVEQIAIVSVTLVALFGTAVLLFRLLKRRRKRARPKRLKIDLLK